MLFYIHCTDGLSPPRAVFLSTPCWTVLFWTEFPELFVLGSAGAAHLLHSIDSLVNDLTEWVQTDLI